MIVHGENHAPRTGMSGEVGLLRCQLLEGDLGVGFYVPQPVAAECDFWLCTLRWEADNADYFFGPIAR